MFSLRSARGRAILAGVVLIVLLAGVATLAVWRVRDDQQRHHTLEQASNTALALEHAHAQFNREGGRLAALVFSDDPTLADDYHHAAAAVEQNLSQARASALAEGEADEVAALDDLIERIGQFNEKANQAVPFLLEVDTETAVQLATTLMSEMSALSNAIIADLDELAHEEEQELAAATAAADRAAETTLWLLIGSSAAALVVAVGAIAMLIVSVVRPLAALRASARAITAGDPEARAKVYGPEEVTSLARDFNEMTDALAAKTQEYIDTANLTGVMLLKLDKDGRCVFLNDATSEFLGRPKEEILGVETAHYLHPDDVEPTTQALREMTKSKEPILGVVSRYVTPLGTRVAEWNAHPLFDEEGQYSGFRGTGRDITERRRAEEELRESESKYRTLLENLPQKIFSKDKNCVYVSCNENYAQDLNIKPDEIIGKTDYDFYPKELAEKYRADDKRIMQSGKTEDMEEAYVQDGKEVFVHTIKTPVRDGDDNVVGILGVFWDITERKQAEDALRDSEERTRLIIETAQDAFITIDTRGVITAWNAQAERTFGWSRSEAVGRTLADTIIPPQHREAHRRGLERFLATGKGPVLNKSIEITAWHHDGHEFPVELAVWPVRSGQTHTFNAFVRDITERKQAQEERERLNAELQVRAVTDGLTGLYNHARFFERLAEEIDRSKRYDRGFALVMMDVDKFKQFNDTRGHQAGDDALCLIADCIRTGVRRSDIAFRYGGDEFAAILLHADSSRAQAIVKRINRCVTRRLEEANDPAAAWLGLSAGVACFPDDATTTDDLVKVADDALYDAKRVSRPCSAIEQEQAAEPLAAAGAAGRRKG